MLQCIDRPLPTFLTGRHSLGGAYAKTLMLHLLAPGRCGKFFRSGVKKLHTWLTHLAHQAVSEKRNGKVAITHHTVPSLLSHASVIMPLASRRRQHTAGGSDPQRSIMHFGMAASSLARFQMTSSSFKSISRAFRPNPNLPLHNGGCVILARCWCCTAATQQRHSRTCR